MKKNDINRMISLIDDEKLIASEKAGKRQFRWKRFAAMAACVALLLSSALILPAMLNGGHDTPGNPNVRPDQPPRIENTLPLKIVNISATDYYSSGLVANDTGFVIKTENGTKDKLEKSVYLDPPVEYTIEELETDFYLLTPENDLPDNTVVSLAQVKDAKITESWAYQTKKDLTVSGTYPRDGAASVSVDSVIEIVLSYADVEGFDEYVSITPELSGKWEHLGKTWRFSPDKPLEKDTLYTVGVRSGFKSAGMTNTAAYGFTFSTFEYDPLAPHIYNPVNASLDGILTFRPGDEVQLAFDPNTEKTQKEHIQISRIALEKLSGADAFLQKLENPGAQVDSTALGDVPFTWQNLSHDSDVEDTVVFNDTLAEGYYIARIYDMAGRERSSVLIQVNRISAYALETLQEVLVWTAQDGRLAEGLSVSYNGSTHTTDKDGIVRFPVAEDKKIRYVTVGETDPLVIGLCAFDGEYINGYVYTDRVLYRENDLVQVWGYVPPEQIDGDAEFSVDFGLHSDGYESIPVTPDEFGCFTASYKLSDYRAGTINIELNYNGTSIAYRSVEVRNYSGQYYSYEILLDKNYILFGDTLEFDVRVTHLSQATVAGKRLYACGQWGETDENGIAHFSVPTSYWVSVDSYYRHDILYNFETVTVSNGDGAEMNSYQASESIYVFNSDIALLTEKSGEKQYTVRPYRLDFDSDVSVLDDPMSTEKVVRLLGTPIGNASVHATMWENKIEKFISGYEYNEYTKEQTPVYDTRITERSAVREWTLTAQDGSAVVDFSDVAFKSPEGQVRYSYELELTAEDSLPVTCYVPDDWFLDKNIRSISGFSRMESAWWQNGKYSTKAPYNVFGYGFGIVTDSEYTCGETVDVTLYDRHINKITDGTVLRVLIQRDVADAAVVSAGDLSFDYPEELTSNIYLAGAYFRDGVFYRIPGEELSRDTSENKLEVTVSPEREEYKPGEEVTLELDVRDASGQGTLAEVSVSVVDEAALALGENDAEIAERILYPIRYPRYMYASYQDPTLSRMSTGWGGGSGGKYRSDFADTAYFGTVITDENGHARVTFKLPDTVTAYRITAQAAGKKMHVGAGKSAVTAKQDFFIQHTEPRKVKTTDDLVVGACGIGGTDDVSFTFTLKKTGQQISAVAENSGMAYANFGKLALGTYTVQIDAKSGEYGDGVEYTVDIISTAQTVRESKRTKVSDGETIEAEKSPAVVEICNTDTARYREYLEYLRGTVNERLDTQIASREAVILENEFYAENAYVPYIDYFDYRISIGEDREWEYLLAPLKNAEADVVLTALAAEYWMTDVSEPTLKSYDPFETALLMAANHHAVLPDLEYLAKEAETDREKLLVSLSYALLGDYGHARESYVQTNDEVSKSLQAMAATFIDREHAAELLDELISDRPWDMYLRFAVLSYLKRNTELIDREESVTVTAGDRTETVSVKGLEIRRLVFGKEEISGGITFTASTENIDVVYYYDTALERLSGDNVIKDIAVSLKRNGVAYSQDNGITEGDELTLEIDYSKIKSDIPYGCITVALPNNLRMMRLQKSTVGYSVVNKDDHLIVYVGKDSPRSIEIPLYAACEGEYTFEPVVLRLNDQYHISGSFVYDVSPMK